MKVPLLPYPPVGWDRKVYPSAKSSLPFLMTARKLKPYVHRPRTITLQTRWNTPDRIPFTAHCWCGMMIHRPMMLPEPPVDHAVCATCEGRAIGAGQIPSPELVGHELIFSPRVTQHTCECDCRHGGPWNPSYVRCGRRARFVARHGEHVKYICKVHQRCRSVSGWDIEEISTDIWAAVADDLKVGRQ